MRDFENTFQRGLGDRRHHSHADECGGHGEGPRERSGFRGGHGGERGGYVQEGRGEHPGRRGGGRGDRLERGAMRFLMLDALRDGPKHGYEIMKGLRERTQGRYAPSPGRVYPILQLLSDLALVKSDSQDDRRVYSLTDAGRAELDANADRIAEFWENFAAETPSEPMRLESEFLQDELDSLTRTVWNGLRESLARSDRDAVRRVRQAVERCRAEVRDLVAGGQPLSPTAPNNGETDPNGNRNPIIGEGA